MWNPLQRKLFILTVLSDNMTELFKFWNYYGQLFGGRENSLKTIFQPATSKGLCTLGWRERDGRGGGWGCGGEGVIAKGWIGWNTDYILPNNSFHEYFLFLHQQSDAYHSCNINYSLGVMIIPGFLLTILPVCVLYVHSRVIKWSTTTRVAFLHAINFLYF